MGTPAVPRLGAMAWDASAAAVANFDSGSERYDFISENMQLLVSRPPSENMVGSRSLRVERVAELTRAVRGQIVMEPTPAELDTLLPRILGAAESTDVFALAETLPSFDILIDRVSSRFVFNTCYIARATFSCSQGGLLRLSMDIEAKDADVPSATVFPATVPAIDTVAPYNFSEFTFALAADASAAEMSAWELSIDNGLDTDRYMNSATRAQMPALTRRITSRVTVPYSADELDLWFQADDGFLNTFTFTRGGRSLLFSCVKMIADSFEGPYLNTQTKEAMMTIGMTAYQSSTTKELVVTSDASA